MRPIQAKDHTAAAPSPGPRLVPPSGPPRRGRPDRAAAEAVRDPRPHAGAQGSGEARSGCAGAPGGGLGVRPAAPGVRTGDGDGRDGPADGQDGPADGRNGPADARGVPARLRAVDADVPAAVGRVLQGVLAGRLDRARAMDPLFARELAARVGRFTREGGKRTRSQLVWWSLRACGGSDEASGAAALRVGAALELLQTCALVHDDVMDGSALRRGRPALHTDVRDRYAGAAAPGRAARFGEAAAILAGDLALAWADDVVAETPLDPWTATVVRRLWSDLRMEMVAGQYLDVQGQVTSVRSLPRALRVACLKSALYSVERPLALGAAVAGADPATMRALCSAGRCVGMAFQLRDDLDDVFGDPVRTGKAPGGDIREGKPTYLVALALARAEESGDRHAAAVLERALGDGRLTARGLEEVREILVRTGARATVEGRIGRLAAQGFRHLDRARLDAEAGARLRRLLAAAAGRSPSGVAGPSAASLCRGGAEGTAAPGAPGADGAAAAPGGPGAPARHPASGGRGAQAAGSGPGGTGPHGTGPSAAGGSGGSRGGTGARAGGPGNPGASPGPERPGPSAGRGDPPRTAAPAGPRGAEVRR